MQCLFYKSIQTKTEANTGSLLQHPNPTLPIKTERATLAVCGAPVALLLGIDKLIEIKPHCIIVGFLKVYSPSVFSELAGIGIDLKPYYRFKDDHFSPREMERYYNIIKKKCDDAGVKFSICYDNHENFERFRYLWSKKNDCCCAKGMIDGFIKTARDVE